MQKCTGPHKVYLKHAHKYTHADTHKRKRADRSLKHCFFFFLLVDKSGKYVWQKYSGLALNSTLMVCSDTKQTLVIQDPPGQVIPSSPPLFILKLALL